MSTQDEQAQVIVRNLSGTLLFNNILALSVGAILYTHVSTSSVLDWLIAVWVVSLARYVIMCMGSVRTRLFKNSDAVLKASAAGSLLAGTTWAIVPAFLLNYGRPEMAIAYVIIGGVITGSAMQGGAYAPNVFAFTTPILVAEITKTIQFGTFGNDVLALDLILYIVMINRGGRVTETMFTNVVVLRNEARALADKLGVQFRASQIAAARALYLANHDSLTGVPNRGSFIAELGRRLPDGGAPDEPFTLFLIDLDHFKAINDTLGHRAGDEVLIEVARRLCAAVGDAGFVARLGGDEFAVLIAAGEDAADQGRRAADIVAATSGDFDLRGDRVAISLSVGVALCPADAGTPGDLLSRADLALYAAKAAGRRGWRRFEPDLLAAAEVARHVEQDLPQALSDGSLQVWFQPQVTLLDGALTGFEALIRWNHPRHGWIAPPLIVASAFKTRACEALTSLVLNRACETITRLDQAGRRELMVAVNVSPREIPLYDLPTLVQTTLARHGIAAERLELEITEEALLDGDASVAALGQIAATGVRLAIDDFGAGSSSLTYLRSVRVDRLKIDRGFVTGLADREGDRNLVKAIIGIGRSLGVDVIAEGVETAEDALTLLGLGCRLAQGYLYGRAIPFADLDARIAADAQAAAAPDLPRPLAARG